MAKKKKSITVQGNEISLISKADKEDYISLTDIARKFNTENPSSILVNWFRNKDTVEFLGVWEKLHNPDFNLIEFDKIKNEAGLNRFVLSTSRWIEEANAIGVISKAGRYGGTYAHRDIALAFCYWVSPPFQLYVVKEFQRLKEQENREAEEALDWNIKRLLSKINYTVHTDAIKEKLIPARLQKASGLTYATEADLLNLALFGKTAKDWRAENKNAKGNIRDHATAEQLLVLANLEAVNAELIRQGLAQDERIIRLNEAAITQMRSILTSPSTPKLLLPEK